VTLERLALARSTLDRAAHRRADPGLLEALLSDPKTRVLALHGDQAQVRDEVAGPRLLLQSPAEARATLDGTVTGDAQPTVVFLGQDVDARAHLVLAAPGIVAPLGIGAREEPPVRPAEGARWAGLREVGVLLDDTGAGELTTAVALANWHATHQRCARCGEPTVIILAGWARSCPSCGGEHYPRTDPAVIMSVIDDEGRILLGRQARWPERRYSTLAGFVEPGESLESAVRREVAEETGVVVDDVTYLGSQPWPFPSSLMLGFTAHAAETAITVDGEEVSQAGWWTREKLTADVAARELLLPPRVSIARRLIEHWYGGEITDAAEAWR
jgi:NAD+ diphosphatase